MKPINDLLLGLKCCLNSIEILLVSQESVVPQTCFPVLSTYFFSVVQVANWPSGNVGSFSQDGATGVVGHYTQLVWGATAKVGCGYIAYIDTNKPQYQYRQVMITNIFANWLRVK